MTTPAVLVRDLRKTFARSTILRGVDLEVGSAEAVALLGPNGAGKSTLLRILAQVARASGGRASVLGHECFPARPEAAIRSGIGFVGHEPLVYLDLTARENLEHSARLFGMAAPRIDAALERVGLAGAAAQRVRTFSRGMLQRLALARATLPGPKLLLLDEPFSALDDAGRRWLTETLVDERARGTTTIVVTHDLDPLVRIATRYVVLVRGAIVTDAPMPRTAAELAVAYRDATVARTGEARVGDPA